MKAKTYNQWVGKRVRLRGSTDGRIGTITAPGGYNTWWLVEWPDGKRTKTPERHLEVVQDDDQRPIPQHQAEARVMRWGNWTFNPKNLTLSHSTEGYEIDLEGIHSSAAILDWIFQIQAKAWADAKTMHDLLRAFDDILHPQANYCSNEQDLRADGGKLAREYAARGVAE